MSNFCILDGDMGRDIFYPLVLTSLCTASLVESVVLNSTTVPSSFFMA